MKILQKTVQREGSISGKGLHTGQECTVTLKPSPEDRGICFFSQGQEIRMIPGETKEYSSAESLRCSELRDGERSILTVEHLLAAVYGLGLSNLEIHVQGPEVPVLDGSAEPFVKWILELGIIEQTKPACIYKVREPIFCGDPMKAIAIYPSDEFRVSYVLDYGHPYLKDQKADFRIRPDTLKDEISPARTFITEEEAQEVRKRGLGLGGNEENTIIIRRDGSHKNKLRFSDECVRHKVLDIVGDLAWVGFQLSGHVVALRSGHALNHRLASEIRKQREIYA